MEHDSAYRAGQIVGAGLIPLVLLLGVVKCLTLLSRQTVNRKCILSLTLVLGGLLLGMGSGGVVVVRSQLSWIMPIAVLAMLPMTLVGLVLAVWGLAEMGRGMGPPLRGKAQAVWALVLGGLFGLLFLGGVAAGVLKRTQAPPAGAKADSKPPGETLAFPDLNFRFKVPPKPWVQMEASKLNPLATIAFMETRRQLFFILIVEKLEPGSTVQNTMLAEVVKANLKGGATSVQAGPDEPLSVNGIEGISFDADAKVGKLDLSYHYWVHGGDTGAYQFIVWGGRKNKPILRTEARKLFEHFSLIAR